MQVLFMARVGNTMLKIKFLWPNFCVCFHHQNVKLMEVVVRKSLNYKKLMALLVCDSTNEECMLKRLDDCPSTDNLRKIFQTVYVKVMYDTDDEICYN